MDVVKYLGDKMPSELGMRATRGTQRPVLPPTVDNTVVVPGMHGAWDFGADMGPRPLPLECEFGTRNSFELQRRINTLAAYLLGHDGRPRTMPVIFSNQPDRQIMARYSGEMPLERIAGLGKFVLPMIAYDPFAYSVYESVDINVDSIILVDSDVLVDTGYTFTITGPGSFNIYNNGDLSITPVVEVSGAFSVLNIGIGGITFSFFEPFSGNLTIDFARKLVYSGSTNLLYKTNAAFGMLPPGTSQMTVSGSGINASLSLRFREKYATSG
ncbi:phage tail family protein [Paenibacillus sp. MSJ-6]|uniref:Phage tail family protein n=1 Tax=Paenibacillus brevis TaxID=2841508 RepID=A0ABS6FL72_9BACL|nr:distal tail protein Dit [Paenibacillus brevis]MBU5670247.1 phage tail family protein [Paenibacillus brevis]